MKLQPTKFGLALMVISTLYQITDIVMRLIYYALYGVFSFSLLGLAIMLVSIAVSFVPAFIFATAYNYFLDKK